ncbi:MAG: hypothetical protein NVSMB33_16770 [Ktedonobacteraceae bacterium]
MTTNSDEYRIQSQTEPIAQQSSEVQTNGNLHLPGGQTASVRQSQIKMPRWTGFSDRTVWDWLQLLAALAVPLAVAFGTIYFTYQQSQLVDVQHRYEVEAANTQYQHNVQTADDQQQEATLNTYLNDISSLLLDKNLRKSKPNDEVRLVARAKTLTALRRLNPTRKAILVQILSDAALIEGKNVVIDLDGADLSGTILYGINLSGANLSGAILSGAILYGADLSSADLSSADLSFADLRFARLININLNSANLRGANLSGASTSGASLNSADLSFADLSGAPFTQAQLNTVKSLQGATMPDGSKHL